MAHETCETGISLCRPMYYDSPEAKEAYDFRNQYMFGDNMMIAPVTKAVDEVDGYARMNVWLPEGQWLEYETGTMLDGGQTLERAFTIDEYPVYIKAGSIIPYYGKVKNLSGNDQPVIVRVFPGTDNGSFEMYEDNGEDNQYQREYATTPLSYTRDGNTLTVVIGQRHGQYNDMPAKRHFTVALPCQAAPESVTVAGKKVSFTYDGINLETLIDLGEINCAAGVTVVANMPADMPALTNGLKAKMHRIQTAVADYKQKDCGMVYTDAFGYLEQAPLRLTYHPELQKQTIETFNSYYDNLSVVTLQQISKDDLRKHFLQLLNEDTAKMEVENMPASCFKTADGQEGFDMQFFNNINIEGQPVAKAHWPELNLDTYDSVAEGVNNGDWSEIAESEFTAPETGDYLFFITGDDGYRLYIDGKYVTGNWTPHGPETTTALFHAEAGKSYKVRVEHFDTENAAILKLVVKKTRK